MIEFWWCDRRKTRATFLLSTYVPVSVMYRYFRFPPAVFITYRRAELLAVNDDGTAGMQFIKLLQQQQQHHY